MFIVKLVFLFLFLILITRLLGKSMIAQLTPHDLITIFFLSYLAFQPIKADKIFEVVVGMVTIGGSYILISKMSLLQLFSHLIIGEPTILIKHGKIVKENLKKSRFSLMELLSTIRTAGYPNIDDIEYAILEPNGNISVLPKEEFSPVTPSMLKDFHIETRYKGLPIAVIIEGKIHNKNLKLINKNKEWLLEKIKAKGYTDIDKVFFATVEDKDYALNIFEEN